jgi:hypothetical protein
MHPPAFGTPSIRTARDAYTIPDPGSLEIEATFTNRTGRTLYVGRCGTSVPDFVLEKLDGGRWVPGYTPVCQSILAPLVPVPPGGTLKGAVRLHLVRGARTLPLFRTGSIPGTYRLLWTVYGDPAAQRVGQAPISPEMRSSNSFQLATRPVDAPCGPSARADGCP